ncbi:peptidase M16, partial [bacterium]|nr:peptidase M16 [bacterium]
RLRIIDSAFQGYAAIQVNSQVPLQPMFSDPKSAVEVYESSDDLDAKAQVTINWMLPEIVNTEESLGIRILEHILTGTSASPLRKALIDSGLGEDLAGSGLESNLRQMQFSTGLKGIQESDSSKVEALVLETLQDLSRRGIDPQTVAASLNTVEFALRENNTGSFPRGLALLMGLMTDWNYDRDPIEALVFEAPLNAIKHRIAVGERYFENLIRIHLLTNHHRLTLLLRPDPQLAERRAAAEQDRLQKARASLTPEQVEQIVADTAELHRIQETPNTPEALATIPMLERSDLEKSVKIIPIEEQKAGESTLLFHDLFTNGILYLDLGFNLRVLRQEWLPYLPVFSRALLETGTAQEDFVQLTQRIGQRTGGIHPSTFTSASRHYPDGATWLFIRGKTMVSQTTDLLGILQDVLVSAQLNDRERIRQIALEEKAGLEAGLTNAGHRVVNSRLKARHSSADWAAEEMDGISQLFFLRGLLQKIDNDWPTVSLALEAMRSALVRQPAMLCNVTLDSASWNVVRGQVTDFLGSFPIHSEPSANWQPPSLPTEEGLTLPSQVNFVGKGANLYTAG